MAFEIVTGTMGGGKSYYTTEKAAEAFARGCIVHTCGADFRAEALEEKGWLQQWVRLPDNPEEWEPHIQAGVEGNENLLICDEATLLFHTHTAAKGREKNKDVYQLLVWSRRYGLDVYFVAQHALNIDSALRRMAGKITHCLAVKRLPFLGGFLARTMGDFRRLHLGPTGKSFGGTWSRFNPAIAALYDTHGFAGRTVNVNRNASGKPKKDHNFTLVVGFIALVIVFVIIAARHFSANALGGDLAKQKLADREQAQSVIDQTYERTGLRAAVDPREAGREKLQTWMALEWDVLDERLITTGVRTINGIVHVFAQGGIFHLGANIEGDVVQKMVAYGGRWYAVAESGRVWCLRRVDHLDRMQAWEAAKQAAQAAMQTIQSPALPPIQPQPATLP